MVAFIHGGAFNFGNNAEDQSSLAKQDMAVVSINYRLGPYGFLYLDQLETGQISKGNFGLQDQLAALKWISMYGGVFGGDKNKVTLDGCSAGSQSAWYHLTSPNSWPYYHSVVSTGIGLPPSKWEGAATDLIRNTVFQKAKVSSIDELRQKSTAQLKDAFEDTYYAMNPAHKQTPGDPIYGPVIDGNMIQDHQVTLVRKGAIRKGSTLLSNSN